MSPSESQFFSSQILQFRFKIWDENFFYFFSKATPADGRAIHLFQRKEVIKIREASQLSRRELYREANDLLRQAGFFKGKDPRQSRFERRMHPIGSIGLPKRGHLVYHK